MAATVLIVPGLREHVADHWQTLLAAELEATRPVRTVPPLEHDKLSCAARVEAVERALEAIDGPVILVAHSAGVMMTVHWATRFRRPIHGALLAAPADVETPMPEGYPTLEALREHGWLPVPRTPLPFPAMVAASRNDPLAPFERVEQMARDWSARFVNVGAVGHLNPAAGFGPWLQARGFVEELERGLVGA